MLKKISLLLVAVVASGCECGRSSGHGGGDPSSVLPSSRTIPWAPGIPGGIPPRTTVCANVKEPPYNAVGDGIHDDTAAIQQALDACPEQGVVFMPAGIYRTTSEIKLDRSHVTLRGAGPDQTRIHAVSPNRAFTMGAGGMANPFYIPITAGMQQGSTALTVADASTLQVGDLLVVDQENDPGLVENQGLGGACTWCGELRCSSDLRTAAWKCGGHGDACDNGHGTCEGGKRALGHIVKITAKDGNVVTIDPPLYWEFSPALHPKVLPMNNVGEWIGIEDLYVDVAWADPQQEGITVYLGSCAYCWLKNVELANTSMYHVYSTHTFRNEFRHNYLHGATCYIGNRGYGMPLQGHVTAALIEDNVFESLASPVSFSSGGGGNVVAYNFFGANIAEYPTCGTYAYASKHDVTHHGAHPIFNLFEGNVMGGIGSDFYWGSSSHHTFIRNRIRGFEPTSLKNLYVITLASHARYFSFLGNVIGVPDIPYAYEVADVDDEYCWRFPHVFHLGYPDGDTCVDEGADLMVKQTLIRHGNFDYASQSVSWDPQILEHALPDSLYQTAQPEWWTPSLPWPPFGPDGATANNKIPAQVRYESTSLDVQCGNGKIDQRTIRLVVDDSDADCVFTGAWTSSLDSVYDFKNTFRSDGTPGVDVDTTVTCSLRVPTSGTYQVYLNWHRVWNSPTATPVRVVDVRGAHDLAVNQNESPPEGGFHLGSFEFEVSTPGSVTVSAGVEGVTTMDAVRLHKEDAEECDDGNVVPGDGCSARCRRE